MAHRLSASVLEGVGVGPPPVAQGNPSGTIVNPSPIIFLFQTRNHNHVFRIGVVLDRSVTTVFNAARHAANVLRKAEERAQEALAERHASGLILASTNSTHTDRSGALVAGITRRDTALAALEDARQRYEDAKRLAKLALYGRSGHGGIAKERPVDADCICGYYVMGLSSWAMVASELVQPDGTAHADDWCRMRAKRALDWADTVGIRALVAS